MLRLFLVNIYKKLFKSQDTRRRILIALRWLPDSLMLRIQYRMKTGYRLNLKNPKRYTEKLQWYKLYYRTPLITRCSDKYTVRQFVRSKGLGKYLNELYAVYDRAEDIDFDKLPDSFAMKCSCGSGMNYFVTDKSKEDPEKLRKLAAKWLKDDTGFSVGREWGYKNCRPRILFERLLPRNERNDMPDYKFFCFYGKVYCLYKMVDYVDNHAKGRLAFYDRNFKKLPYYRQDYGHLTEEQEKPACFEEMLKAAEILSSDFPHVRVDFYDIGGRAVFGEMTFYNACGFFRFEPDEFDFILGKQFRLPKPVRPKRKSWSKTPCWKEIIRSVLNKVAAMLTMKTHRQA